MNNLQYSMGWMRDLPSMQDYAVEHKEIAPMLEKANISKLDNIATLPTSIDLKVVFTYWKSRKFKFYERKAFGKYTDASRLFLYKATKDLLGITGNSDVYLRTTMEAMALFGVVPEKYWPYNTANVDLEPTAFCYSFGKEYKAIKYLKLDPINLSSKEVLLKRIKANLAAAIPAMFGFTVFPSITYAIKNGKIPFPLLTEKYKGGHAIVAAGYDDNMVISHPLSNEQTKGALLIRNSWGVEWGVEGYGWLPYEYILKGLAIDWWTLLKMDWIDTGNFQL